ncbi:hypothetical protein Nepgr_033129 [Nepenthes gracilis]|uniref:Uncharacterized protein n=1 Tax=Nepenthes gracilis TaxID=150966 RepID=A0AAD3TLG0_NEPGR|nr:hypothetical protein Nepgr_033129 [Nepenthes gracilis]
MVPMDKQEFALELSEPPLTHAQDGSVPRPSTRSHLNHPWPCPQRVNLKSGGKKPAKFYPNDVSPKPHKACRVATRSEPHAVNSLHMLKGNRYWGSAMAAGAANMPQR